MPLAPVVPYKVQPDAEGRLQVLLYNSVAGTYDILGPAAYDSIVRDGTTGDTAAVTANGDLQVTSPNRIVVMQETGNAALAASVTMGSRWELVCMKLHLSAVGGAVEAFTATLNSATNAVYDVVHYTQAMAAVVDLVWIPSKPIPMMATDTLDFAYANSNARVYGLEVHYRPEV